MPGVRAAPGHVLSPRDALADHVDVPFRVVRDGSPADPVVTIAIPTFRRQALLIEATRSAAAQRCGEAIEILIVDNDPDGANWPAILEAAPDLAGAPVRYVVNAVNIGMLGNWNRCIAMARGEWLTILNDDDLLDPDFIGTMLGMIEALRADGLVCGKRTLDEREPRPRGRSGELLAQAKARVGSVVSGGLKARRITARQMFWGNPAGNPVGFLCRTALFRGIGGFYPEEYPSADYFFFTRFALRHDLRQTRRVMASIRVGENESMRPDVLYGFLRTEYRIQQALAATVLPRWWGCISPWLVGHHAKGIERMWRVPLDPALVEERVGVPCQHGRHRWLHPLRAILRGF